MEYRCMIVMPLWFGPFIAYLFALSVLPPLRSRIPGEAPALETATVANLRPVRKPTSIWYR